jgi:hypothetical protein
MQALLLALMLSVPPAGKLSAPLGHYGNVVEIAPLGGQSETDWVVRPNVPGCEEQGVFLSRFIGGTGRMLEQLQSSLDAAPGLELKLFRRPAVLSELMVRLRSSKRETKAPCTPLPLLDGYRLEPLRAPMKWCPLSNVGQEGEHWYTSQNKPSAVISVRPGSPSPCKPRLSAVLFDKSGRARVWLRADWGDAVGVTLVGDGCQLLEYSFDPESQSFEPRWKSCKKG